MSIRALSGDLEERLRWAIREGLVIAGILVFWLVVGIAISAVLSIIAWVLLLLEFDPLRVVYTFTEHGPGIWAAVVPLTGATTGLYVLARVGTVLIDRYQAVAERG